MGKNKDDAGVNKLLQLVNNPGGGAPSAGLDEEDDPVLTAAVNAVLAAASAHCKDDIFDMQEVIAVAAEELRMQIREQAEAEDGE